MSQTATHPDAIEIYYHDMAAARDRDVAGVPFGQYVREDDVEVPVSVFDELYEPVATDTEAEDIGHVYERWNAGTYREAEAFLTRECTDCDASFTAPMTRNGPDIAVRQDRANTHERETGHTVEDGLRSVSVGDIIFADGEAYLCAPLGWERQPHLDEHNE